MCVSTGSTWRGYQGSAFACQSGALHIFEPGLKSRGSGGMCGVHFCVCNEGLSRDAGRLRGINDMEMEGQIQDGCQVL